MFDAFLNIKSHEGARIKFLILFFLQTSFAQQEPIVIIGGDESTYETCQKGLFGPSGPLYFEAECTSVIYPATIESADPSQPPEEPDAIETKFTLQSNNSTCDFYNYGVQLIYLNEVDANPIGDRVMLAVSDVQNILDDTEALRPKALATSIFDTTSVKIFARLTTQDLGQRTIECQLIRKISTQP